MKRILLEIMGGLAVLVLLASFHHQLAKLRLQNSEVSELRTLVQESVVSSDKTEELDSFRTQILSAIQTKLEDLEAKVAQASLSRKEANELRAELGKTKKEAALIKAQLREDINRTQECVDAYQAEMRARNTSAKQEAEKAQSKLEILAGKLYPNSRLLTREVLAPAVQLNGDDTVGSGTLVCSTWNPKTKTYDTYVLTSYHVVRNILADTPRARREGISVTIYKPEQVEIHGDLIAHNPKIDAALLKLRSKKQFTNTAKIISKERARKIQVWDRVYAVGCPLGNDPIPTQGEVSCLQNELNGSNYWMINAPTYFGNSGGGVYVADRRELAGVFSKIYTHGRGSPVVIPHMGLFTPMPSIYDWLEKAGYAGILKAGRPAPTSLENEAALLAPAPGR